MHNLPTMVTILKGHTGLVKGVTWDPVRTHRFCSFNRFT